MQFFTKIKKQLQN